MLVRPEHGLGGRPAGRRRNDHERNYFDVGQEHLVSGSSAGGERRKGRPLVAVRNRPDGRYGSDRQRAAALSQTLRRPAAFPRKPPPGRVTTSASPVTATDPDNNPLTYTLEGADASSFRIVGSSGQIRTRSGVRYDYETKSVYFVTVKADDGNGGTAAVAVTINVTDVAEDGSGSGGTRSPSGGGGERRARAERRRLQAHRPPAIFPRIRRQARKSAIR